MRPLDALAALLVPPRCLACGTRAPEPWCRDCDVEARGLRIVHPCRRCGGEARSAHGCWPEPAPVVAAVAAYRYEGPVARAVVAAKARGAWAGWRPLGERLAPIVVRAIDSVQVRPDVVTWLPADRGRVRRRGYDHARLLAGPVAAALDVPVVDLLRARPGRPDQAGRSHDDRRRLAPDTFVARRPMPPACVLLVDDVLTTGATVTTAARALRAAGAADVVAAVLARAGDHELVGCTRPG